MPSTPEHSDPTGWRQTAWGRLPAFLGRPPVYRTAALLVFLAVGTPTAYVWWARGEVIEPLTDFAIATWSQFPDSQEFLDGMTPERRAQTRPRLESALRGVMPTVLLAGILLAFGAGLACLYLGRFLRRWGPGAPRDDRDVAGEFAGAPLQPDQWFVPDASWLAGAIGFLVHVPFMLQSFDTDEAWAFLHLSGGWLQWASTWQGWEVHMGGELLGRLAYAALGFDDFFLRVPSAVLSSCGLAIAFRWVRREHGAAVAWLTAGLLCALPLWTEQTAELRGYGLLFFAGAWNISVVWRLLDGSVRGAEPRALAALTASLLAGFLAHFFFVFYALAILLLLVRRARAGMPLAAAGVAWGTLALIPAGVLYLPGVPATVYQSTVLNRPAPPGALIAGLVTETAQAFGLPDGPVGVMAMLMFIALWLIGLSHLKRAVRHRMVTLVGMSLGIPLLLNPVFLHSRFFIHLLPFGVVAVLPLARWARRVPWGERMGLAAAGAAVLWTAGTAFGRLPLIDLREAGRVLARLARPGDQIVIDHFLIPGQVYLPAHLRPRYVNTKRPVPPETDLLMITPEFAGEPPGDYVEVASVPGRELPVIIYRRISGRV